MIRRIRRKDFLCAYGNLKKQKAKSKKQKAKSKFSDVVKRTPSEDPQSIAVRCELVLVRTSPGDYVRPVNPQLGFVEFMQRSPMAGAELDTSRQADVVREIALRAT